MTTKTNNRKLTDAEREAYALVGRHGGRATFKKRGRNHMSTIGKRGARKRWLTRSTDAKKSTEPKV